MGGSSGAAGSPDDAGVMEDVAVLDANANDGRVNPPDVGTHDSCVPTGPEVCDGIDNNCSGRIDENACRDGCVGATFEGVGYMFCYSTAQQRTWKEAETDCEAHKMHLARVDSAMQNSFIRKTALDVNFSDNIWLGGSDAAVEGRWVWIDDAQFWMGNFNGRPIDGLFTAWDMGQPNSASGQEDCLAMWANTTMWHDSTCGTHEAYMCQGMPPLP